PQMPFLFPATTKSRRQGSRAYHTGSPWLTREGCSDSILDLFTKELLGEPTDYTMGHKNLRLSQPEKTRTSGKCSPQCR
ncbi:Hypothetical predicted protein, partial [Pelobates cultripes]